MDLGLAGRTAFVTGSSSGLAFAAAMELARAGCNVAICSRNNNRIEKAAGRIREEAAVEAERILSITCDVTSEDAVKEAINQVVGRFGSLNILVTNAGGPPPGFIEDFSADDWRQGLELNLVSTVNLCRHALPHLRQAASGSGLARIIMITSISAKQPIPSLYLSNTARAGVQGFAKSLAAELGPEGITVNTLLPGYTRTDRLKNLAESIRERTGKSAGEIEAEWADGNVLKRIGEPEEFAAAVAFLASGRAGYITGVALPVDGGTAKGLL